MQEFEKGSVSWAGESLEPNRVCKLLLFGGGMVSIHRPLGKGLLGFLTELVSVCLASHLRKKNIVGHTTLNCYFLNWEIQFFSAFLQR